MSDEKQTCPRRMREPGPWEYEENLDSWERGRWAETEEEGEKYVRAYMEEYPNGSCASPWWRGPGPMPRTCSFCGGVNPGDAIELLKHGWESHGTDKGYKRYLEPPGSAQAQEVLLDRLKKRENLDDPTRAVPSVWHPVPPVKLYTMHFSKEQVDEFNAVLDGRKGPRAEK